MVKLVKSAADRKERKRLKKFESYGSVIPDENSKNVKKSAKKRKNEDAAEEKNTVLFNALPPDAMEDPQPQTLTDSKVEDIKQEDKLITRGKDSDHVSERFICHLRLPYVSLHSMHLPVTHPPITRRKSCRKTPTELRREEEKRKQRKLDRREEKRLKVVEIPGKGRGVIAKRNISKGNYICEYIGDLMTGEIGRMMEKEHERNGDLSCTLYFNYKSEQFAIDATSESSKMGRLINHSKKFPNSAPKVWELSFGDPRVIFEAARDIQKGEEILYDYNDRRKHVRDSLEWLKE